jgi:hypothetical protein
MEMGRCDGLNGEKNDCCTWTGEGLNVMGMISRYCSPLCVFSYVAIFHRLSTKGCHHPGSFSALLFPYFDLTVRHSGF